MIQVIATSANGVNTNSRSFSYWTWCCTITGSPPNIPNIINTTHAPVYTAYDVVGSSQITRFVNIVDKEAPTIELIPNPFFYEVYSETVIRVIITDNYSTGLTAVLSGDTVDKNTDIGTYTIRYTTQDSSGNQATSVERTVIVRDTTPPVINLIDDSSIIIEAGDGYQDPGVTFSDNYSQPKIL